MSKFVHAESLVKSELDELKAENAALERVKIELEQAKVENDAWRNSQGLDGVETSELKERIDAIEDQKKALQIKIGRLTKHNNELQDELEDANNTMQAYVAKEATGAIATATTKSQIAKPSLQEPSRQPSQTKANRAQSITPPQKQTKKEPNR